MVAVLFLAKQQKSRIFNRVFKGYAVLVHWTNLKRDTGIEPV
jgi:hypothetical protein